MASGNGTQYLRTAGESPVRLWQGLYYGYIAVNQDPLDQGRVKLRVPQVFGNTTSGWASPMVPVTFIPKVGTQVTVMFVGGDPAKPVWFGNFAVPPGGTSVTTGTATPNPSPSPEPEVGAIYYQVNGSGTILGMFEWNGAGWVDYYVGSGYIAPGTVVPGIINGTVVNAATLENSSSNPKTSVNPDGSVTITNSAGQVIYEVAPDGTVTWYSAAGAVLMQQSPTGFLSIHDPAQLQFPSGASYENFMAGLGVHLSGTLPAQAIQLVLASATTTTAGARDQVYVELNSAAQDNSSDANMQFVYQGSNGTAHLYGSLDSSGFSIEAGSIAAAEPGSSPATPAAWDTVAVGNGWSGYISYKKMPDSTVQVMLGQLVAPGSSVNGVVLATLPTGFRPVNNWQFPVSATVVNSGYAPSATVNSDGTITTNGVGAGAHNVSAIVRIPTDF